MSSILNLNREEGEAPGGKFGYEGWTKAELEAELASRDLSKTGSKAELIARLEEDDAA